MHRKIPKMRKEDMALKTNGYSNDISERIRMLRYTIVDEFMLFPSTYDSKQTNEWGTVGTG